MRMIFILLLCSISYGQTLDSLNNRFWFSAGIGVGTSPKRDYNPMGITFNYNLKRHIFEASYFVSHAQSERPGTNDVYVESCKSSFFCYVTKSVLREYNVSYGRFFALKKIGFAGSIGLGYCSGSTWFPISYEEVQEMGFWYDNPENFNFYRYKSFQSINCPIDLDFYFFISKWFGIRVNFYSTLNKYCPNYGISSSIVLGRLR